MSEGEGFVKVIPAAVGFLLGALFIFTLDKVLPHVHINFKNSEAEGVKKINRLTKSTERIQGVNTSFHRKHSKDNRAPD